MNHAFRRRNKLARPALQLRMVAVFLGLTLFGLVLQFVLMAAWLSGLSESLGDRGAPLLEELPSLLFPVLGWSLLFALPATAVIGVLETFRIAGPLSRIERYLEALERGEAREPCRIRKEDELQQLVQLLNRATEPLRSTPEPGDSDRTLAA